MKNLNTNKLTQLTRQLCWRSAFLKLWSSKSASVWRVRWVKKNYKYNSENKSGLLTELEEMRHLWNGLWKTKEHGVPRHRTRKHVAEDTGKRCTPVCEGLENTESHDTGQEGTSQWTQGEDAHLVTATAVKVGSEGCCLRLGIVQQCEHLSVYPASRTDGAQPCWMPIPGDPMLSSASCITYT